MYTKLVNFQILIALMKKHGIKHIVISAGQTNYPFARSVETDDDFTCYSVVDERSAAFFAMGLSQELQEPVAIVCTASTACCNYLSAVTEAYYQGIPLLVITCNKDIRDLGQQKLLMIRQDNMFENVTKKEVQLPEVNGKKDFIYCQRLVNEALLELDHFGKGPVHIDVPNYGQPYSVTDEKLPDVQQIMRHTSADNIDGYCNKLSKAERILVICGQGHYSDKAQEQLSIFSSKYNCVIAAEQMANLNIDNVININRVTTAPGILPDNLIPDIMITMGRNIMDPTWNKFRGKNFEHWYVDVSGNVVDPCDRLTDIFQYSAEELFNKFNDYGSDLSNDKVFYNDWKASYNKIDIPELPLCHITVINELFNNLPQEGIIHYSIYNSIRISQHFDLPKGFTAYANMGALGIDGCLSTFIGQSVIADKPAFLIIGDLSFFYDMNALKIKHIKNNVHILLLNNSGGAEFYQNNGWYDTLDLHTAAKHSNKAEDWAKSNNFEYISVHNKEELKEKMQYFVKDHNSPIMLEVFDNIKVDMESLYAMNNINNLSPSNNSSIKNIAGKILGESGKKIVKSIIGKG